MLFQELLRFEGCHTAGSGRGDRLAIAAVLHIPAGKNTGHARKDVLVSANVAVIIQVELACKHFRVGLVPNAKKQRTDHQNGLLQRDQIAQPQSAHFLLFHSQDLLHSGVGQKMDLFVGHRSFQHDSGGAKMFPPVNDSHFCRESSEEQSLFHCGVSPADHGNLLAGEKEPIACGATADAMADQRLLTGQAKPARGSAAGNDQSSGMEDLLPHMKSKRPFRKIHAAQVSHPEIRAEPGRLDSHILDELRSLNPLRPARKIFDQRSNGELAARLMAFQHEWFQVGPCRIDCRCQAGTSSADNYGVSNLVVTNLFCHRLASSVSAVLISHPTAGMQAISHRPASNEQQMFLLATRRNVPKMANSSEIRPRVLIVGGGFAGIQAAMHLAGEPVEVTLVDRRNHHTFQPLLYQVALAALSPGDIAQPIRALFRKEPNIDVLMDEVVAIDTAAKSVGLKSSAHLSYDYLILATGATHSYFGHDEWAASAPGLKTIEDAIEIRRRVLLAFELAERQKLETGSHPALNFVVVGGGPTGVELAGAISDISRLYMQRDFRHIDPSKAHVIVVEGSPRLLAAYPEDLSRKAAEELARIGVEVRNNAHVTDIQPGFVVANGERIESVVTLWAAGVQASPLGKMLGAEMDKRGSIFVDEHLNPQGHPEIFVCGDLAHAVENGKQIPGVAQPAMQMGTHAAKEILADLAKKPRTKFHYFDKGDMATIGRHSAVANVVWPFHAHLSGFPAWMAWLLVHIYFLIGFRNRALVLLQWTWMYFGLSGGPRLITGSQKLPGWPELTGSGRAANGAPLDVNSPGAVEGPLD